MPVLVANVVVPSREPILRVENRFAPGVRLFRLTVVDDGGNESRPAFLSVTVLPELRGGLRGFGDMLREFISGDRPSGPEDRE